MGLEGAVVELLFGRETDSATHVVPLANLGAREAPRPSTLDPLGVAQ
jgi:hypothetical protein